MSDTMLFLLLLVAYVSPQARGQNSTTYQHTDRATGQLLTCDKCRPGYYLREHCTATQPSKCALCEKGLYTECWNYVSECLICDGCYENQDISRPCSPRQNTKCVCKKGYFWSTFYCKRHTVCPSGYGVKTPGTHEKDTECELCPAGFYAAGHPATCQKHTACEALTKITVLKGASWHDAFCASCENVVEGCSEILRRFLPSFFAHFNMNKAKLQRLVGKMGTPATRRLRRRSQPNMKELLSDINAWVAKAPVHELQKLPEKLESVQLYHPAEKLKRKIDKITAKKQSHCNEHM